MSDSNRPVDHKTLNRDRIKFGVASLLYNGDEIAFAPLHTAVIRALGGGDVHLGLIGALTQSMGQMFSWLGAVVLRLFGYNRKAMVLALGTGALVQALIVATLVAAIGFPGAASACLLAYIGLVGVMCVLTGAQQNIAVSWIGDLVPSDYRGRFVGGMAIVSNIGLIVLQLLFARLARHAELPGYAGLVGLLFVNTLLAVALTSTITNRPSQAVTFVSNRGGDRVHYGFWPMWALIWFECAWRSGRVALMAFSTAYMIDYFGFKMDRIILIHMIVNVVNVGMLYLAGRWSDKIGIFKPLALISGICGLSMLLWVGSAWWGVMAIIVYQFINGAAGSTHWMLCTNLGLLIYPPKGRPNYISFSRVVIGLFLTGVSIAAGYVMAGIRGWEMVLWGAEVNHYHLFFLGCTLLTLGCLIPLFLLKNSRAYEEPEE